jgi:hypothetical protein
MKTNFITAVVLSATLFTASAFSQNVSFDARRIAMGAVGGQGGLASKLVEEPVPYRAIPVPLGLLQVLRDVRVFDPTDPKFDPIRAVEDLASPLHYTFYRGENSAGRNLVRDLVNGRVNRDLNAYRGFTPASQVDAQGLWSPDWGKTLRVSGFHSVFVGAGPYVSLGTNLKIDQNLIDVLASPTNVYRPNTTFTIGDLTTGQGAVAITGGYRGRLPIFGIPKSARGGTSRDGLYIGANFHQLFGLHYDTVDLALRFDTDQTGQITLQPNTTPIVINRTTSRRGRGVALDLATAVVINRWDFSVGANGVANRIEWDSLSSEQVVLQSLFQGRNFVKRPLPAPTGKRRVSLPVQYAGAVGYRGTQWSARGEVSQGLQELSLRGGGEHLLGPVIARGGGRYQLKRWHASAGIGFNVTKNFGIDLAAFQTTANIERKKKWALALSLRFDRSEKR